jgi:hypothetical protein
MPLPKLRLVRSAIGISLDGGFNGSSGEDNSAASQALYRRLILTHSIVEG